MASSWPKLATVETLSEILQQAAVEVIVSNETLAIVCAPAPKDDPMYAGTWSVHLWDSEQMFENMRPNDVNTRSKAASAPGLRDEFAKIALGQCGADIVAIDPEPHPVGTPARYWKKPEEIAARAYAIADAMLTERAK